MNKRLIFSIIHSNNLTKKLVNIPCKNIAVRLQDGKIIYSYVEFDENGKICFALDLSSKKPAPPETFESMTLIDDMLKLNKANAIESIWDTKIYRDCEILSHSMGYYHETLPTTAHLAERLYWATEKISKIRSKFVKTPTSVSRVYYADDNQTSKLSDILAVEAKCNEYIKNNIKSNVTKDTPEF